MGRDFVGYDVSDKYVGEATIRCQRRKTTTSSTCVERASGTYGAAQTPTGAFPSMEQRSLPSQCPSFAQTLMHRLPSPQ